MDKQIFITRPEMLPIHEYIEKLGVIWDSSWITNMGQMHDQLKTRLKSYLGVERIELFTNGHTALETVLDAFELEGEVITTPFTFASTTHAIVRQGLIPVFCDINPGDYTIDVNKLEALVTDKTSAILPVHVYGHICNEREIARIAAKYGLKVIYDAAHAFGVKQNGTSVLEYGDAAMLSFHATKVFNTVEGGAVIFHEDRIGHKIEALKDFGIYSELEVGGSGQQWEVG